MTPPLRVLHVIASLSPLRGGTTTSLLQIIAALEAKGIVNEIVATDDDGPGRLPPGAPERALPGRTYVARATTLYGLAPGLGAALRRRAAGADLVHVHGLFSHANGVAGRIAREMGRPYVVTPHGMANRYGMAHKPLMKKISFALVERRLLTRAAAVHMTSAAEAEEFSNLDLNVRVETVPLPVSRLPSGSAERFLAAHPDLSTRRRVLFMGRLDPIKNISGLINAASICRDSHPNLTILIAGTGVPENTAALADQAKRLGVDARFLGFLGAAEKAEAFAAADLFALPSLSESFGLAAVEALGAGLPLLLGARVAVGRELAAKGFATLAEPDPASLAEGLATALDSLSAWDATTARAYFACTYAPDRVASKFADLYRSCMTAS